MVKVLIVENEIESGQALTILLQQHFTDIKLLGVYPDIASAATRLRSAPADIVFLDIELDGESGFELFDKIGDRNFDVIFTTAFPSYAVRAIKYACLEYLLKPIQQDELIEAIRKFREKKTIVGYHQQIETLLHNLKKPNEPKLCIPISGGFVYLNKSEIIMCQAEANYTLIYSTGAEKLLCSKNIGSLENVFDDENMFRCHKSYLININHIKKIQTGDDCRAHLTEGLSAEVSQRKKEELRKKLGRITS